MAADRESFFQPHSILIATPTGHHLAEMLLGFLGVVMTTESATLAGLLSE
jgi:hypothetical protein